VHADEGPSPEQVQALVDRQAIHDTVLRYCRGIDRLDRELVQDCYHPDATDEHGPFRGTVDEFLEWVWPLLAHYRSTMHVVANHLVEVRGDLARSEAYGIAYHRADDPDPKRNLTVGFRYLDRFERRQGGPWRIARRVATTEWVRATPPDQRWPIPDGGPTGRRDETDPLYRVVGVERGPARGATPGEGQA